MIFAVAEARDIRIVPFFIKSRNENLIAVGRKPGACGNGKKPVREIKRIGLHGAGGEREARALGALEGADREGAAFGIHREDAGGIDFIGMKHAARNSAAAEVCVECLERDRAARDFKGVCVRVFGVDGDEIPSVIARFNNELRCVLRRRLLRIRLNRPAAKGIFVRYEPEQTARIDKPAARQRQVAVLEFGIAFFVGFKILAALAEIPGGSVEMAVVVERRAAAKRNRAGDLAFAVGLVVERNAVERQVAVDGDCAGILELAVRNGVFARHRKRAARMNDGVAGERCAAEERDRAGAAGFVADVQDASIRAGSRQFGLALHGQGAGVFDLDGRNRPIFGINALDIDGQIAVDSDVAEAVGKDAECTVLLRGGRDGEVPESERSLVVGRAVAVHAACDARSAERHHGAAIDS